MTILAKITDNLTDVRYLGPGFLLRHLAKLRKLKQASVVISKFGRVHFRPSSSDAPTLRQVFIEQQYDLGAGSPFDERAHRRYRDILAAGRVPVIVDAGANIGAASLWFHDAWPEAAVVAIEPEHGNAEVLRKNLDGKAGYAVVEAAIGAERGAVCIANEITGSGAMTARAESGIPVITIDDAVARIPNGTLFIAKIDIEGFEQDLFSSNTDWLDRAYIVIIEPHDWMLPGKCSSRAFQRAMADHDFEMLISGENLIYIRPDA